jgi:class 3 adenylate cyclase
VAEWDEMEKLCAILFADIVDSVQLYERVGNAEAARLNQTVIAHARLAVEAHHGEVIKSLGDGLLAVFDRAEDAGWTAASIIDSQEVFGVGLRIGLHFGPIIQGSFDVFGDACNVAARVQAIARAGEVLATEDLVKSLSASLLAHARCLNNVSVKGRSTPLRIYQLWGPDGDDEGFECTVVGTDLARAMVVGGATLRLTYRGRDFMLNRASPRLLVGRDESCQVRVLSPSTSRKHAVLDFSRETFMLTDHSTNGTFVRSGPSLPMLLKRDATKLVGQGLIGFGAEPTGHGDDHEAAFRCEPG